MAEKFKFNLIEFIVIFFLVYVAFAVGSWFSDLLKLSSLGILGTIIAMAIPVLIIYYALKKLKWRQQ